MDSAVLHNEVVWALRDLVVPVIAVVITSIIRNASSWGKAHLGPLWPFVAAGINRLIIRGCYAIDIPCEGNVMNWQDPDAYAYAQTIAVVGLNEGAQWVRKHTPLLLAYVKQKGPNAPG